MGYGQQPVVRELRVVLPRLPAEISPLRVLHFADPHLRGAPRENALLLGALLAKPADLIACTGDLFYSRTTPAAVALAFLKRLRRESSPRFGLHLVCGNNDDPKAMGVLAENGFSVLINRSLPMPGAAAPWCLAGVDDPFTRRSNLAMTLNGVPDDAFKILLSHSPDVLYGAARFGVDLVLAGHTHGGQIRLPLIGALFTQSRISPQYAWGVHMLGKTVIHTTCGAGASFPPIRVNCPAEVVRLELVRG